MMNADGVKSVLVVGSGVMGSSIAEVFATGKVDVTPAGALSCLPAGKALSYRQIQSCVLGGNDNVSEGKCMAHRQALGDAAQLSR